MTLNRLIMVEVLIVTGSVPYLAQAAVPAVKLFALI
jgi:hypothetical protein